MAATLPENPSHLRFAPASPVTRSNERTDERTHVTPNDDCAILEVSDVRARVQANDTSEVRLGDERLPNRFWAQVEAVESGCWQWLGSLVWHGYGRYLWEGKRIGAYRAAYLALVGPIPDGLYIDHLCRNRACVNPAHLEPVTPAENSLRGESPSVIAHRTKRCSKGHRVEGDNVYVTPGTGRPRCLQCIQERRAALSADPEARARHAAKQRERYRRQQASRAVTRCGDCELPRPTPTTEPTEETRHVA